MLPEPDPNCETCRGLGYIDETLGGCAGSNTECPCPDCVDPVPVVRHVFQPACICKWFARAGRCVRLVNFECTAHSAREGKTLRTTGQ